MQIQLRPEDWMTDKKVNECQLRQEGINILGVLRDDGTYVGIPKGETQLYAGDRLILYGRSDDLKELDRRRRGGSGDQEHQQAMNDQKEREVEQDKKERAYALKQNRQDKR